MKKILETIKIQKLTKFHYTLINDKSYYLESKFKFTE